MNCNIYAYRESKTLYMQVYNNRLLDAFYS